MYTGYDWQSFPSGTVFADVGAGIGNFSLEIAKIRPDFTFILEDRPPVMEKAKTVCCRNLTNSLSS